MLLFIPGQTTKAPLLVSLPCVVKELLNRVGSIGSVPISPFVLTKIIDACQHPSPKWSSLPLEATIPFPWGNAIQAHLLSLQTAVFPAELQST